MKGAVHVEERYIVAAAGHLVVDKGRIGMDVHKHVTTPFVFFSPFLPVLVPAWLYYPLPPLCSSLLRCSLLLYSVPCSCVVFFLSLASFLLNPPRSDLHSYSYSILWFTMVPTYLGGAIVDLTHIHGFHSPITDSTQPNYGFNSPIHHSVWSRRRLTARLQLFLRHHTAAMFV